MTSLDHAVASPVRREQRRLLALTVVLCALALGGCSVRLISDYDETIDLTATQLQRDMDAYLTQLESATADEASYGANRQYYAMYATEIRSLLVRAQAHPKNEISLAQYELMLDSLGELEASHRGEEEDEDAGVLPPDAIPVYRDLFNQAWGAIIKLEVSKKTH